MIPAIKKIIIKFEKMSTLNKGDKATVDESNRSGTDSVLLQTSGNNDQVVHLHQMFICISKSTRKKAIAHSKS